MGQEEEIRHLTGWHQNHQEGLLLQSQMDTKQERELQYSPSRWSHRFGPDEVITEHVRQLLNGSNIAKETVECEVSISYGLSANERLDIFGAQTLPGEAPIVLYIHGGYWQALGREYSSFLVSPLCKAGAVVMAIGYDLAPKAGMDEMVSQVKKAVTFALKFASRRGSRGVYLVGHSAGGHLAALMLATDWMTECMINSSLIRGAILLAGVFDLRPLVDTYVNDPIKMSQEEAIRNSPVFMYDEIIKFSDKRTILVAVGEHDSPEFKRQSLEMNEALVKGGIDTKYTEVPDTDHFNLVELLRIGDYTLTQEIIHLVGLNLSSIEDKMDAAQLS